ncbi:PREDICTED: proline-rich protein HaeIII subfamily 1-like [Lepidothrix coronata]|uniref:Proline-rich protein HaeIII subfamily 1-like n=1 Tax=Lepidothrix coronata TaxID=321398 RepID=A0A6J0GRP8_9PASS|nr:PREDICTED: proline-rich protein HaeIII subfamily 1-like [Lepidothrix coronata]
MVQQKRWDSLGYFPGGLLRSQESREARAPARGEGRGQEEVCGCRRPLPMGTSLCGAVTSTKTGAGEPWGPRAGQGSPEPGRDRRHRVASGSRAAAGPGPRGAPHIAPHIAPRIPAHPSASQRIPAHPAHPSASRASQRIPRIPAHPAHPQRPTPTRALSVRPLSEPLQALSPSPSPGTLRGCGAGAGCGGAAPGLQVPACPAPRSRRRGGGRRLRGAAGPLRGATPPGEGGRSARALKPPGEPAGRRME